MNESEKWNIEIQNENGEYVPFGFKKPYEYATKRIAEEEAGEIPKKFGKWRVVKAKEGATK